MKVLVFPALLAIAIITGPPKPGTTRAASAAPTKPVSTVTMANLEPEKTTHLTPAAAALAPIKAPLAHHPAHAK